MYIQLDYKVFLNFKFMFEINTKNSAINSKFSIDYNVIFGIINKQTYYAAVV